MSLDTIRRDSTSHLSLALVLIAAGALLARLVLLGERVAHFDEGRVAYWILQYVKTGYWTYTPIIHGPFFVRVNPVVFDLLGTNDFTMRLVVALLGGLLPLSAWLFRERLRDVEVVALALLLAINPLLLYYSRFMRNDLPLAAFMLFGLGFLVRLFDTRRPRYLYAAVAMVALAATTKENVLVYLLTWVGAAALLLDHRLFLARENGDDWTSVLKARVRAGARAVWRWRAHLVVAFGEALVIVVYFYAPRGTGAEQTSVNNLWADPTLLPAVVREATIGSWQSFVDLWVNGPHQDHAYLPFLTDYLRTLEAGALVLVALAVVGFVVDRYARDGPRDLVSFAAYWGFVSILGYPLITDIKAPWAGIHAVVPLAIPAAVGLGLLVRWGLEAFADDDPVGVGLVAVLLLILLGNVAVTAVDSVYLHPTERENELVQFVQPEPAMRDTLDTMHVAIDGPENPDVLFFGPTYGDGWTKRLPLQWYLERWNATQVEASDRAELEQKRTTEWGGELPPVIVTHEDDDAWLRTTLVGYERYDRYLATYQKTVVIYVKSDESATA